MIKKSHAILALAAFVLLAACGSRTEKSKIKAPAGSKSTATGEELAEGSTTLTMKAKECGDKETKILNLINYLTSNGIQADKKQNEEKETDSGEKKSGKKYKVRRRSKNAYFFYLSDVRFQKNVENPTLSRDNLTVDDSMLDYIFRQKAQLVQAKTLLNKSEFLQFEVLALEAQDGCKTMTFNFDKPEKYEIIAKSENKIVLRNSTGDEYRIYAAGRSSLSITQYVKEVDQDICGSKNTFWRTYTYRLASIGKDGEWSGLTRSWTSLLNTAGFNLKDYLDGTKAAAPVKEKTQQLRANHQVAVRIPSLLVAETYKSIREEAQLPEDQKVKEFCKKK